MKIVTGKLEFSPLDRLLLDTGSVAEHVFFNGRKIPIMPGGKACVRDLLEGLTPKEKSQIVLRDDTFPGIPQSASASLVNGATYNTYLPPPQ